jgi:hypothetical protein
VGQALVTDLYELNVAARYLRRRMGGPATFSLFVRKLPATRGFLVAGRDLTTIPHAALDLRTPHAPTVRYSEALLALADEVTHRLQQPPHPVPSRG